MPVRGGSLRRACAGGLTAPRNLQELFDVEMCFEVVGQRVKLVYRKCPGRRDHVLVELRGGLRRAIALAATSLADHIPGLDDRTVTRTGMDGTRRRMWDNKANHFGLAVLHRPAAWLGRRHRARRAGPL